MNEIWVLSFWSLFQVDYYYFSSEKNAIDFINEFYEEAYESILRERSFSGMINNVFFNITLYTKDINPTSPEE